MALEIISTGLVVPVIIHCHKTVKPDVIAKMGVSLDTLKSLFCVTIKTSIHIPVQTNVLASMSIKFVFAKKEEVLAKVEIPKTHEVEEEKPVVAAEAAVPGAVPTEGAAPASGSKEAAPAGKQATAPAGKQTAAPQAGAKAQESKPPKK